MYPIIKVLYEGSIIGTLPIPGILNPNPQTQNLEGMKRLNPFDPVPRISREYCFSLVEPSKII